MDSRKCQTATVTPAEPGDYLIYLIPATRETFQDDALVEGIGSKRTPTFVLRSESEVDVGALDVHVTLPETAILADESDAHDLLHRRLPMRRVDRSGQYRGADGTSINQAESHNLRFRRMQIGQPHRLGLAHLSNDANEAAYREGTRRRANGEISCDILTKCAHAPPRGDRSG